MVGRRAFRAASWLNSRVKANVILGNLGSSLAQLGNIPQGIAHAKQHSLNGFLRTIRSLYEPNKAIAQSDFIKERFLDKLYRQFDTDLLSKPRNLAVWLMESMDKVGTHFIWNSAHEKAIKEGIKNPIKYADDVTRDMVAGRGIGEVPIGQKIQKDANANSFYARSIQPLESAKGYVEQKRIWWGYYFCTLAVLALMRLWKR